MSRSRSDSRRAPLRRWVGPGRIGRATLLALAMLATSSTRAAAQDTERLYQEACDAGDLIACNVFGLMYETGEGVPRDVGRAAVLYQKACEGGELVGCTNLGLMFEAGVGVPQDLGRAVGLYQVACEGGEMLACSSLVSARERAGAPPPGRFYKAGRVGDAETGAPLSDALVEIPELGIRVVSDASGRIELAGLPPGRYPLTAERAGYQFLDGELQVPGTPDFVILLTRDPTEEVLGPGRIVGRVLDEDGETGLADVEVAVRGPSGARTLSDARGRFELTGLEPGLAELRFARLGYAPRTATLIVQPGRTVELSASMSAQPIELEAIEVSVRSAYLERAGFYQRSEQSSGSYFTAVDLETIDPIVVSDLVRRVPGVALMRMSELEPDRLYAVSRRVRSSSGRPCVLPVYIDGMRIEDPVLDQVLPEQIEAIEMYPGVTAPMQYGQNPCGVVLIWTRRGR